MQTDFFNRTGTKIKPNIEGIYVYYFYLFNEKFSLKSVIALYFGMYLQIEEFPINHVIIFFYTNYHPDTCREEIEKMLDMYKLFRTFKQKKNKSKEELIYIQKFLNIMNMMKKDLVKWADWYLKNVYVLNWVPIMNNNIVSIEQYWEYQETEEEEDEILEPLCKFFLETKEKYLVVDGTIGSYLNEIPVEQSKSNLFEEGCFYSFPLFNMTYGKDMSKENMESLRGNILNKMEPLNKKLDLFKAELREEKFGETVRNKTHSFFESLKQDAEIFQSFLNNHMFIKQVLNSDKECFNAELRIGVCSTKTLVKYFEKSKILLPFVADALEKKISNHLDLDKSDAFLYIVLPKQILDKHIPKIKN